MPSPAAASKNTDSPPQALKRFLKRVLGEHAEARASLAANPVHDLRVALRRSRSLAEGFATLDDDRDWRRLRKAAKELQSGLAALRDAQVMTGWVRQLRFSGGPAGAAVAASLRNDERKGRRQAQRALDEFPRKRWKRWRRSLAKRARQLPAGPASFAHLALQRAREAAARERRWRHSQSQLAAHSLRIAVKHFRYTVQSFLPQQYAAWEEDLRRMQDALGEMHDLDVLRGWLVKVAKQESLDHKTVQAWLKRIAEAREERVGRYRKIVSEEVKPAGSDKHAPLLWDRWQREIEDLERSSARHIAEEFRRKQPAQLSGRRRKRLHVQAGDATLLEGGDGRRGAQCIRDKIVQVRGMTEADGFVKM
jgi:CHAD domain-containing protein